MMPTMKQSSAVQAITPSNQENLTVEELEAFMNLHGFSDSALGEFLGVTLQAVRLWRRNQREISLTTTKVVRLMVKFPHLMKEF